MAALQFTNDQPHVRLALVSIADGSMREIKRVIRDYPMSASLSPDGKYLVYDSLAADESQRRHIVIVETDSGREVVLLGKSTNDFSPIWSPDGRRVIYISDRSGIYGFWAVTLTHGKVVGSPELVKSGIGRHQPLGFTKGGALFYGSGTVMSDVYLATLDVASSRVTSSPTSASLRSIGRTAMPDWSSDGRYLALRAGGTSLSIVSSDTGAERRLSPDLAWFLQPRWSPDGTAILALGKSRTGTEGLYTIDVQSGRTTTLLALTNVTDRAAAWGRDGQSVYYSVIAPDGHRLVKRNLRTGHEREIFRPHRAAVVGDIAISADGSRAAFWVIDKATPGSAVLTIVAGDGRTIKLVQAAKADVVYQYGALAWTPDGRHVLYLNSNDSERKTRLWAVPSEGGESRPFDFELTTLRNLALHPDGRRIALTAGTPTGEVWMLENF